MTSNSGESLQMEKPMEEVEDALPYNEKTKVECICPMCGKKHIMSFHWIGRGTPRKYCPTCRGSA
jgi:hypothetical protein